MNTKQDTMAITCLEDSGSKPVEWGDYIEYHIVSVFLYV